MVQWVWPVPLFLIACFAPESLWYLVKVGREDDARATTKRLAPSEYLTDQLVDRQIALMKHTIEMEKAETQGASFLDCFKGSNTNLGHDGNGLSSTGPAKTSSTTPRSTCRPTE